MTPTVPPSSVATAVAVPATTVTVDSEPAVVARYLDDAAHFPGGQATAVARPRSIAEVAAVVRNARTVLAVGAQSSLTGGATPTGGTVLSTERLTGLTVTGDRVRVGAGVTLATLQQRLAEHGLWFPPVPTYLGATVGGVISTNAAGAATYRYGPVRPWVERVSVVLVTGDLLHLARGDVHASDAGQFVIATSAGELCCEVPAYRLPDVVKCSAGYYSAPGMDLIDLFIGAEGTLGVIVEAEMRCRPTPAGVLAILVPLRSEDEAIELTRALRDTPALAVAGIEHIDRRSIDLLKADGVGERLGVNVPPHAAVLLLVQIEVSATDEQLTGEQTTTLESLLERFEAADTAQVALPTEPRRAAALFELREAVPAAVNRRVAVAHARDPRVHKTAADMIVPYPRFAGMMQICRTLCAERDLDLAIWGHISDGNVHPNIIPRDYDDVVRGREAILELGRAVIAMGGSPLAEHGVGRSPIKQQLLEMLYGREGIEAMRRVKRSLDPSGKLAPGVVFSQ